MNISLMDLWIPIVASAAAVFIISCLIWMVFQWHKSDWGPLPDEDGVMASLRSFNIAPGMYGFPNCGAAKGGWKDPDFMAKWKAGPCGCMIIVPSNFNMGLNMAQWFGLNLLISVLTAYVASSTLHPGADFAKVFQVTGTVVLMTYGISALHEAIWKHHSWKSVFLSVFDGVLYCAACGAIFAYFWPKGAALPV
ncbi:MAG TPA: hypothetical protein VG797_11010 [Phycisphaerales bacterium]|nr:hypothetical protein [Phycisphaerales bacterium]